VSGGLVGICRPCDQSATYSTFKIASIRSTPMRMSRQRLSDQYQSANFLACILVDVAVQRRDMCGSLRGRYGGGAPQNEAALVCAERRYVTAYRRPLGRIDICGGPARDIIGITDAAAKAERGRLIIQYGDLHGTESRISRCRSDENGYNDHRDPKCPERSAPGSAEGASVVRRHRISSQCAGARHGRARHPVRCAMLDRRNRSDGLTCGMG